MKMFRLTGNNELLISFCMLLLIIAGCNKELKENGAPAGNPGGSDTGIVYHYDKPNIILILGEEMGYEVPTCNGGQSYETPTLDMLAQVGMRFTGCHGSPLCSPSRTMLMTGKYNYRNYYYYGKLAQDQRTFANILQDANYETAVYGKWAMDGGDSSIRLFGFDHYTVWNPFKGLPEEDYYSQGSHYKNPLLYRDGAFVDTALTSGKYGDDIFCDSIMNFIEYNKNKPFFAYYPMTLSHGWSSPTPDDPEFAAWDNRKHIDDSTFFPSMVKYADKLVGKIVDKVKSLHIENETVILVVFGDNGTREGIHSMFNGRVVAGGRLNPTEIGTHVPFFAYWPGTIAAGAVNDDLISFVDFLPTLAGIANVPVPTNYGTLDGVSFAPRLRGEAGTPRDWIFCHYQPFLNIPGNTKLYRWVQNSEYKLYDSSSSRLAGKFFRIVDDADERNPLHVEELSPEIRALRNQFIHVLAQHK